MSRYLETVEEVYADAARQPDANLCCTKSPVWRLPDLRIPERMLAMNYGCGSTVDLRELRANDTVVYVGVGGGLEALQFAYCTRRAGGVIAVDPVAAMRECAAENFAEAARVNPWFRPEFVTLVNGSALDLPLPDSCATVAAQNCLFNIFTEPDLKRALAEICRVLKPSGRFYTSDPITPAPLPPALTSDDRMRAHCLSGCQTFDRYLNLLAEAGFGKVEVRARTPYRLLCPSEYPELDRPILLESVEVAAMKEPEGDDGPAVFLGRMAIYAGPSEQWAASDGTVLRRGVPVSISEGAAKRLGAIPDLVITEPNYRSHGGGCC
jgi:ubiquinone/menaquinone biosynthesis C-methylase UbiE